LERPHIQFVSGESKDQVHLPPLLLLKPVRGDDVAGVYLEHAVEPVPLMVIITFTVACCLAELLRQKKAGCEVTSLCRTWGSLSEALILTDRERCRDSERQRERAQTRLTGTNKQNRHRERTDTQNKQNRHRARDRAGRCRDRKTEVTQRQRRDTKTGERKTERSRDGSRVEEPQFATYKDRETLVHTKTERETERKREAETDRERQISSRSLQPTCDIHVSRADACMLGNRRDVGGASKGRTEQLWLGAPGRTMIRMTSAKLPADLDHDLPCGCKRFLHSAWQCWQVRSNGLGTLEGVVRVEQRK
jgi:hypothetical protein